LKCRSITAGSITSMPDQKFDIKTSMPEAEWKIGEIS
jgi:hypothetical protein